MYNGTQWNQKNMKEAVKLNVVSLSSNNDRYLVLKTFIPLHYTSLHLSTLHFFATKFHPSTLQYPLIWLNPI